jgi:hypothetical protein
MKFVLTGKYMELADIRGNIPHTGIDLRMAENTILRSVKEGFVEHILHNNKIGNGIVIKGTDGKEYIYGHLNKVEVSTGQHVFRGQEIGLSGNTGNSSAPHLHFGIKENGHFIDPTSTGPDVAAISGSNSGWFVDKWNQLGDYVIGKEKEFIGHPIQEFCYNLANNCWHWFIANLPDIIGYTAIGGGILIILSAMTGRGILKPIGFVFGAFVLAACILGGVKG